MKIGQIIHSGQTQVFVEKAGDYLQFDPTVISGTLDLVNQVDSQNPLSKLVDDYIAAGVAKAVDDMDAQMAQGDCRLTRPIHPPEAWAVGVTYKRQALEHDKDLKKKQGKTDDLYTYVYENERAEVFFKGFSRTIVGSSESLYLRADSKLVMPEAELVLVIGRDGLPVGYTLGNDLTAWDIESECPLYLNQAKIWTGSGSIGPYIVPIECTPGPYSFDLQCVVIRDGEKVLEASGSTEGLKRSIEELCYFLNLSNRVESGTVLYTGTTCVIDHDFALQEKDIVEVSCPIVGTLSNSIKVHDYPKEGFTLREEFEE